MGILGTGVDYYLVYRFIKTLVTPFKKTKAYELGIIDDEGKILKKKRDLETEEEKKAYGYFDRMIWNLKKMIRKVPLIGKSALASFASASYLILKETNNEDQLEVLKRTTFLKFVHEELSEITSTSGFPTLDDPVVHEKPRKKYIKSNKKRKKKRNPEGGRKIISGN